MNKSIQAKDIPERPILEFLKDSAEYGNTKNAYEKVFNMGGGETENNPKSIFHGMPESAPHKVGLAKMRAMIKKGLVGGCACGCRGDFYITLKGKEALNSTTDVPKD